MFLDQPVFTLLPLVFFYYLCPIYLGYYIGRCGKSAANLIIPFIILGLFFLLRPREIESLAYIIKIILPVITLLFLGYLFGSIKKKNNIMRSIPYIIGITGLPCSGKSEASSLFKKLGAKVVDVDQLGHKCLTNKGVIADLASIFGDSIVSNSGEIDRNELAKIVFDNSSNLKQLESILHPEMIAKIEDIIKFLEPEAVLVLDAAILQHMKLDRICKRVFVTYSDASIRLNRAAERGWNADDLNKRDEAVRRSLSYRDITLIENNNSKEQFNKNIERIWKDILNER